MKKCFSHYHIVLVTLSLIANIAKAKDDIVYRVDDILFAGKHWHGSHVHDVKNHDIIIKGEVTLPHGGTRIEAIDRDITIYLEDDVVIRGHDTKESRLYLFAGEGRTIRFFGTNTIEFVGSQSGHDLLIVQGGLGETKFAMAENTTVSLSSRDHSGAVRYYVLMQPCRTHVFPDEYGYESEWDWDRSGTRWNENSENYRDWNDLGETARSHRIIPTLSFEFLGHKSHKKNSEIIIGKGSLLSFLSPHPIPQAFDSLMSVKDVGRIQFDPARKSHGRMALTIENGGAFVIAGSLTHEKDLFKITLKDINPTVAAGYEAIWKIYNSQGSHDNAGLLVINKNKKLFDLLFDPFGNLHTRSAARNYKGNFSGIRYGAVIGANGVLQVDTNAYLDYVGVALNKTPYIHAIPGYAKCPDELIKQRNPSALFIDGNHNPNSKPAKIEMHEKAALFFRSGIANNGTVRGIDNHNPFTINPSQRTPGIGNIVFDVEGRLDVHGSRHAGEISTKIELLSLEVAQTGGSLFVCSDEKNFPKRTFEREDGEYLRYNSGAFLINNRLTLKFTSLSHTDENHKIYQENDIKSEPVYVGGETFKLEHSNVRPAIRFINSYFLLNTSAAATGLDLIVPNFVTDDGLNQANVSEFTFYANSPIVDNGTGRQLILGTQIGSTAANGSSFINGDAHLDIVQQDVGIEGSSTRELDNIQTLVLQTAANNESINPFNTTPVRDDIHTIFLGNSSNISVGINNDFTPIDTMPTMLIDGNFFSFTSKGGPIGKPDTSNITGKGGIFVDLNGEFTINPGFRASFGAMVTKSHNGIVTLPTGQVFFEDRIGIANWKVDLRTPHGRILVPAGQSISDYTFNWIVAKKDFSHFTPYNVDDSNMQGGCASLIPANVTSLPTIQGTVDQFQIQGTRIGDPANILVDGGNIRELVFLNGNLSAGAPVAVVVLQNDGIVGVGASDTSGDSLFATTTLGVNGVTIIANGSGRLELNQDLVINNMCAFVKGPDFVEGDRLQINTTVPREIRIKNGGILDLRSFNSPTDIISLIGDMRVFVEPGAIIILGGGTLAFTENSQLVFETAPGVAEFFNSIPFGPIDNNLPIAVVDASIPHNQLSSLINFGRGLQNTNPYRVRLIGQGRLLFADNAQAYLPSNTFLGIETLNEGMFGQIPQTDIEITLAGNADFIMGHLNNNEGGVLQVGNVVDAGSTHSVNFTLTINGSDAQFLMGSYAYLGLGTGIERYDGVDATGNLIPNALLIDNLFNVGSITLNFLQGQFNDSLIYSGDQPQATLLAISNDPNVSYNINYLAEPTTELFNVAGGGNMVLVSNGTGAITPVVEDQTGVITDRFTTGMLASTPLQQNQNDLANANGQTFFDTLQTNDALTDTTIPNAQGMANAALVSQEVGTTPQQISVGAVIDGEFERIVTSTIVGFGTPDSLLERAVEIGAVAINIDQTTGDIIGITSI